MKKLVKSLYEYGINNKKKFVDIGLNPPTKKWLDHVTAKHTSSGAIYRFNKLVKKDIESIFMDNENIVELALEAWKNGKLVAQSEKIYSFGRNIGFNKYGKPTNVVKIIVNKTKRGFASFYPMYG